MFDPHEALHNELRGRYELEDVLGEGGMGTVYLAQDLKHDRLVAIKTLKPDLTTQDVLARFQREISITAHLQHPHIVSLLDSGVAGSFSTTSCRTWRASRWRDDWSVPVHFL